MSKISVPIDLYLLQHPQFVNNSKNINIKNKILLSPLPQPPNKLLKQPQLLLQPHPQSLSSGILLPPSLEYL